MSEENQNELPGAIATGDAAEADEAQAESQDSLNDQDGTVADQAIEDVPEQAQDATEPEQAQEQDETAESEPVDADLAEAEPVEEQPEEAPAEEPEPEPEPEPVKKVTGMGDLIAVGILSIILGVLLCLPAFLGGSPAAESNHDLSGGVAATADGVQIGENDVSAYIANFRATNGLESDEDWAQWLGANGMTAETARSQIATMMVYEDLMAQAIKDQDVSVSDSAVDERVKEVVDQLGGEEAFEQALQEQEPGITIEEYRDRIRSGLEQQALAEKVAGDVTVDDQEVLQYLKLYSPDQVSEDAESLEGIDEEAVSNMRDMLKASAQQEAMNAWFQEYIAGANVVVADMPEGLAYDVEAAPVADVAADEPEEEVVAEVAD